MEKQELPEIVIEYAWLLMKLRTKSKDQFRYLIGLIKSLIG